MEIDIVKNNRFEVSVSNNFYISESLLENNLNWYSENNPNFKVKVKKIAKYKTYKKALQKAREIYYNEMNDLPCKTGINSIFIYDYISGEVYSNIIEVYKDNNINPEVLYSNETMYNIEIAEREDIEFSINHYKKAGIEFK